MADVKIPDPRTELSEDEIAAIKAKLPHLAEPFEVTPALLKALEAKQKQEEAP
jgi:hypothetical protein